MNQWVQTLGSAAPVVEFLVKAAVLWLVGWAATRAAWRASAATREMIWRGVCVGVLALPVIAVLAPGWSPGWSMSPAGPGDGAVANVRAPGVAGLSSAEPSVFEGPFAEPRDRARLDRGERSLATATGGPTATAMPAVSLASIVLAIWIGGLLAVLLPLVRGSLALRRLRRSATVVPSGPWIEELVAARRDHGVRREIEIVLDGGIEVPMIWGGRPGLDPVLALPEDAIGWDRARIRSVLLHEVAHLRRQDGAMRIVARLALALSWPLPFAWAAWRRMLVECEQACDDLVLGTGERPSTYAEHLLSVAIRDRRGREAWAVATPMARAADLGGRIRAVLDADRRRVPPSASARNVGAAFAGLALLPLGALSAGVQDTAGAPPKVVVDRVEDRSAAEGALDRGLEYLIEAQDESTGGWIADIGFKLNSSYRTLAKGAPHVGVTALALTALLEAGPLPAEGARGRALESGTLFLLASLETYPGYIQANGSRMKSHGLALEYLARLYARTRDEELGAKLQTAIEFTVKARIPNGWRYVPFSEGEDILNGASQLLALKAARDAGLEVPAREIESAEAQILAHRTHGVGAGLQGVGFRYQDAQGARVTVSTTAAGLAALADTGSLEREFRTSILRALPGQVLDVEAAFPDHFLSWHGRYLAARALESWAVDAEDVEAWESFRDALHLRLVKSQGPDGSWANTTGPGCSYTTAVACILLQR